MNSTTRPQDDKGETAVSAKTLVQVNGEELAVPGLRFWGMARDGRISIVASNEYGAAELWTREEWLNTDMGGIEIHSPSVLFDFAPDPIPHCDILNGPCWTDGSSLAYSETFLPWIRAGSSPAVLSELAEWHASRFGGHRG